ncbi:MAG: OmpA family protein [Alphaproteobacteria bacterium]|nr:OmpA family protein [Alphaproteobacteria bacterium]MBN2780292.1 OmpA family protein [Alphaproteobacteria bacterium]
MRRRHTTGLMDQSWSGFVDLFSNLILFLLFVLFTFMLAQFFMSLQLSNSTGKVSVLSSQVSVLSAKIQKAEEEKEFLYETLSLFKEKLDDYAKTIEKKEYRITDLQDSYALLHQKALFEKKRSKTMEQEVQSLNFLVAELEGQIIEGKNQATKRELNRQVRNLEMEMKKLNAALDASDQYIEEQEVQIVELSQRLNRALAGKTAELHRYQSVFFKDLSKALDKNKNVRAKGDRFVIQAEMLFKSGSAIIGESGQEELQKVADMIQDFEKKLPKNVSWIIRVDGHTDATPIVGGRFKSNWELSTARAVAVVNALIEKGVSPKRLAATGFGENQPLTEGKTTVERKYNRRIEFHLTNQ